MPVAAAALFLAALGSCDSDPVVEPEPPLEIVPDSVTLTHIGHQFAFTVRGRETVRWNSRDLDVFTVDADGTVTARGNGTAQVQAWTPESSDHALVRVRQSAAGLEAFGEEQRAAAGLSLIEPVGVRVLDSGGAPVSGAAVRFEPASGDGRVDPGEVQTDSTGVAAAFWTLGPEPGPHTLAVSADAASVEITATALHPDEAMASVEILSGEDQWAVVGHALPDSVSVRVTDEAGRLIRGASVRFEPEAGGGRADPGVTVTDSLGLAAAVWTLGPEPGAQRMVVTAGEIEVGFDATAVSDEGVCNRTPTVSAEIVRHLVRYYHVQVSGCAEVTDEVLRNVEGLDLAGKGLRRLRSGDFDGLLALEVLYLHDNELAKLPLGLFDGLARLNILTLQNNQLTELPPKVLANLDHLDWLILRHNRLSALHPDVFRDLSSLTYLDLSSNELARLSPDIFEGLLSLESLHFWSNRMTELAPETFAGLHSLKTLRFGFNELTDLSEDLFDGLSSLETLTMRGNMLTSLPEDVFAGLPRLGYLIVGDNRLTKLPPGLFSDTPALWRIALDGNRLTELPPELFSDTLALQRLYLQDNRLETLPPDIFARLQSLVRLDLSRNDLAQLPRSVFSGTPKLAELSLEYNDLTKLPRGVFAGLSELEWATLGSNPGAPFPVRPEFVRVDDEDPLAAGPAVLVARVPVGAPFAFDLPVSVQRGTISKDFVSLLPGDTASAPFTVAGTGAGVAAHVGFGPAPEVTAAGHTGLAVVRGEELVLFGKTDNRSPFTRLPVPAHRMQAGGPSAELELDEYFGDPEGDPLVYSVEVIDSGVVGVGVEDGVLRLDPLSVDTTEVEVTATDPGGLRATQRFRAWVVPEPDPDAFDIELYFEPGFTPEEEATIRRAADRWMEAVTGDLPDVPVRGSISDYCRYRDPANLRLVGVVDDVLIRMRLVSHLDGNLATAGHCAERESGHDFIAMNSFALWHVRGPHAEVEDLYRSAMHEIGHVLGFGDWIYGSSPKPWRELFRDGDGDGHFAGPLAVAAFDAAGGGSYTGGKVPTEDRIPVRNIHWRKRVIPGDIMAPGGTLLTAITLQALADIGHEVDLSKADPYTLPSQAHADVGVAGADAEGAEAEMPVDDVIEGPVVVVDKDGKVVRIIRR